MFIMLVLAVAGSVIAGILWSNLYASGFIYDLNFRFWRSNGAVSTGADFDGWSLNWGNLNWSEFQLGTELLSTGAVSIGAMFRLAVVLRESGAFQLGAASAFTVSIGISTGAVSTGGSGTGDVSTAVSTGAASTGTSTGVGSTGAGCRLQLRQLEQLVRGLLALVLMRESIIGL